MRKLALKISIFLLVIFILILFLPTLFKKTVSEIVLKELNESVNASVTFSDADINLWRHFPNFTFTLEDFSVLGKDQFKGDTLIHAKDFHLVISSWQLLLFNNIELKQLKFQSPQFHIITLENGASNYDLAKSSDAEKDSVEDLKLEIESLKITNGKILYEDKQAQVKLYGESIMLSGDFEVEGPLTTFNLFTETKNTDLIYDGSEYLANKNLQLGLNASYDISTQKLQFRESEIKINDLEGKFEGNYQYANDDQFFDLKFATAQADFSDIVSLNDILKKDFHNLDMRGLFSCEGSIKGVFNEVKNVIPTFDIKMKVSDGYLKYKKLKESVNSIQLELIATNTDSVWENSTFDLKNFNFQIGENPVRGKAVIKGLRDGKIDAGILAKLSLQDLHKIYPLKDLNLAGEVNVGFETSGTFSGDLTEILKGEHSENKIIPTFALELAVNDAAIKYNELPESIHDMHLILKASNKTGKFNDTSLKFEKIHGIFGDNPLKGFVHIDGLKNSYINSSLAGSIDLSEVQSFMPIEGFDMKGLFDINMDIKGTLNDSLKKFPIVNAKMVLKDGYLKSTAYNSPVENAHLILEAKNTTGKISDTKLLIDTLTYRIEDETFLVEGSISDLESYSYNLDIKGILYLDKLSKILDLSLGKMSGEVDIDLETSGNLADLKAERYHKLPTEGQVMLKSVYLKNDYLPHGLNIERGHIFFSNEKAVIDTLHGAFGTSKFNLSGHLYNYLAYVVHADEQIKGDLVFESEHFSINDLLADDLDHRDTVHHDLVAFAFPSNIDFTFDSKIHQLLYKDIILDDMDGEIVLKDGVLKLNNTKFKILESEFNLSGDYDPRNVIQPKFDIAVSVKELDIKKAHENFVTIQTMAPAAEHTYGILSLDYKLSGELHPNFYPIFNTFKGAGTIRISDAQVNGMKLFHHISGITKKEELKNPKLKDITMETWIDAGTISVKPFNMKLAGFDTDIEGQQNFSGSMNYILRIAIPPFDLVKIPLHINGTYENPKIHLGKGHEETFAEKISYSFK